MAIEIRLFIFICFEHVILIRKHFLTSYFTPFKARIHCEIFLSDYFMKCVFTVAFHCINYREMFMIYFLRHFMKHKNSENRFSEFSLS